MKKFIPLMIMLLVFSFSVSAAAGDSGADATATTKVSLDLTQDSIVELWFAEQAPSTGARMPASGWKNSVELDSAATGVEYDNAGDPVYACWYISGGTSVKVEMQIASALKSTTVGNTETIKWGVSATQGNLNIKSNGATPVTSSNFLSYTYSKGSILKPASGSTALTIATDQGDFSAIPTDEYSADLILKVVTGE